tara:strand:+ start:483 stop:851 length:369 start_codon:yes stop_codon:yes gene_type:complete
LETFPYREEFIMGRGASRSLDWDAGNQAMDEVLSTMTENSFWVEDIMPRIIDRYQELSGHKLVNRNHYPTNRFVVIASNKAFLQRGWSCKQRLRTTFSKIDGEKRKVKAKKRKAFRIVGEEE